MSAYSLTKEYRRAMRSLPGRCVNHRRFTYACPECIRVFNESNFAAIKAARELIEGLTQ